MIAEFLARWQGKDALKTQDEHRPTWFDPSAIRAVDWTAQFFLFGLLIVLLAANASRPTGVLIACAIAAFAFVFGFLFGIPRVPTANGSGPGAEKNAAGTPQPTAGLEQVADWLTKIILGAGLTSLGAIKGYVVALAHYLAACVCTTECAAQTQRVAFVFGLAVIGYFSAIGFLAGYLSTRLLLARLLRMADKSVEQIAHETGERVGKEQALKSVENDLTALVRNATQAHFVAPATDEEKDAISAAADWKPAVEPTVDDDPQSGRFGGKPEANARRLDAKVSGSRGENSELFRIDLKVTSTDPNKPLAGPVKFFLHDTFDPDTYVVVAVNNVATLEDVVAWGAFTVGVMCDGGQTKLELDLATIPDAPTKFRAR